MGKLEDDFNAYRTKMNDRIMESANTNIKRFFALDCIKYHLGKCHEAGVKHDEMNEVFMIANLVGGSIVIPHYRRAVEYWDELNGVGSGQ